MSRTIEQLAREALDVQDACNLCGVAQSFARAMVDLNGHCNGTVALREHPITRLWLDKMTSLAGIQDLGNETVLKSYDAVYRIVGER